MTPLWTNTATFLRTGLAVIQLLLVLVGTSTLVMILYTIAKSKVRMMTNVYVVALCLANFLYLLNLSLVAATQLNQRSWPFGPLLCSLYHGTETTGKYASVLLVVLLAVDRHAVVCRPSLFSKYRSYAVTIFLSLFAFATAFLGSLPLFAFSEVATLPRNGSYSTVCVAIWPSIKVARWYVALLSVFIFVMPLTLIGYCYYKISRRLLKAQERRKRLRMGRPKSGSPYQHVTTLVLWIVIFHMACWSPFWIFNMLSAAFRFQITALGDRLIVNFIHLLPYVNCALNPILYAVQARKIHDAIAKLSWRNFRKRGALATIMVLTKPFCAGTQQRASYVYQRAMVNQTTALANGVADPKKAHEKHQKYL